VTSKITGRVGCAGYWILASLFSLVFLIGDCFNQQCRDESRKQFFWYWLIVIVMFFAMRTAYRALVPKDTSD
jgi:hypothetical protein